VTAGPSCTVCPNCSAELYRDPAPRLPRILPRDGLNREYLICPSCWKRLVKVVLVDRVWDERP
jgi:uncharacterized protein with PIN domain